MQPRYMLLVLPGTKHVSYLISLLSKNQYLKSHKSTSVPEKDDIVIGTVEAVMGSMMAILIKYINGKPVNSQVECICPTRNIRKRNVALVKDLVKLKIIGHLNGAIHVQFCFTWRQDSYNGGI